MGNHTGFGTEKVIAGMAIRLMALEIAGTGGVKPQNDGEQQYRQRGSNGC